MAGALRAGLKLLQAGTDRLRFVLDPQGGRDQYMGLPTPGMMVRAEDMRLGATEGVCIMGPDPITVTRAANEDPAAVSPKEPEQRQRYKRGLQLAVVVGDSPTGAPVHADEVRTWMLTMSPELPSPTEVKCTREPRIFLASWSSLDELLTAARILQGRPLNSCMVNVFKPSRARAKELLRSSTTSPPKAHTATHGPPHLAHLQGASCPPLTYAGPPAYFHPYGYPVSSYVPAPARVMAPHMAAHVQHQHAQHMPPPPAQALHPNAHARGGGMLPAYPAPPATLARQTTPHGADSPDSFNGNFNGNFNNGGAQHHVVGKVDPTTAMWAWASADPLHLRPSCGSGGSASTSPIAASTSTAAWGPALAALSLGPEEEQPPAPYWQQQHHPQHACGATGAGLGLGLGRRGPPLMNEGPMCGASRGGTRREPPGLSPELLGLPGQGGRARGPTGAAGEGPMGMGPLRLPPGLLGPEELGLEAKGKAEGPAYTPLFGLAGWEGGCSAGRRVW